MLIGWEPETCGIGFPGLGKNARFADDGVMRFLPVQWVESLPSTNLHLRDRIAGGEDVPSGTVVATLEQTAGRGRFDRRWVSVPGRDLTFSFVIRTAAAPERLGALPMAVALGVAETIETWGLQITLKWPNDILIEDRKICGILSERVPLAGGTGGTPVVVGIGLNVNMDADAAARIPTPTTSLRIETGLSLPLELVLQGILLGLPRWIGRWESEGFAGFRKEWLERALPLGTPTVVEDPTGRLQGILAGYGDQGELLVRDPGGMVRRVRSGDLLVEQASES